MRRLRAIQVIALAVALVAAALGPEAASSQRRRVNKVKVATIAPKNSVYHEALLRLREEWREISGGSVDLAIYPGGVVGDEVTTLRKMRAGQIQAALISGSGMSFLDEGISALQVPLMFRSPEEFDFVRSKMAPILEERLAEKGFKVLGWGDAGTAYFFGVEEFRSPDDLREMKIYTAKGDDDMLRLYGEFGLRAVPLDLTELQANLETGLVDVFAVPPLVAAGYQWFGSAPHMLDMPFMPIVGALLISNDVWERIPADQREAMLESSARAAERIEQAVRSQELEAIREMRKYGLQVMAADADLLAQWNAELERAYPGLRDRYAPGELIDAALRWRDEFRSR